MLLPVTIVSDGELLVNGRQGDGSVGVGVVGHNRSEFGCAR
jgi:hypothetical protein